VIAIAVKQMLSRVKKANFFIFDFFTLGIAYKLPAAFKISGKIFDKGLLK